MNVIIEIREIMKINMIRKWMKLYKQYNVRIIKI